MNASVCVSQDQSINKLLSHLISLYRAIDIVIKNALQIRRVAFFVLPKNSSFILIMLHNMDKLLYIQSHKTKDEKNV